jgi:hypothetical protein
LQVVGRNGYWLKLQLRNGSTGWIYHSLAQPESELLEKPHTVLRGSEAIGEPFSMKTEMLQNGSELSLVYPE